MGENNSFLSIFAQPVDYVAEYSSGNLIPNALLLQMNSLINDERIIGVNRKRIEEGVDSKEAIDKSLLFAKYHTAFEVAADEGGRLFAKSDEDVIASFDVTENGISLHSEEMENLWLTIKNDVETSEGEEDEVNLLGYIEGKGLCQGGTRQGQSYGDGRIVRDAERALLPEESEGQTVGNEDPLHLLRVPCGERGSPGGAAD